MRPLDHDTLRTIASRLRIVHHIPGRIRLRLEAAPAPADVTARAKQWRARIGAVRGVRSLRVNVLARSCTIEYDPREIPEAAWPDLLADVPSTAAQRLFDILAAKWSEIADTHVGPAAAQAPHS